MTHTTTNLPAGVTTADLPGVAPDRPRRTFDETVSDEKTRLAARAWLRRWTQVSGASHVEAFMSDGITDPELLSAVKFLRAEVIGDFERAFSD